ncbi:GlxA family transcriptional regulator [Aromatoleum petrolei]|uniref:Helix-turn-helix domain-containing protein n=1 Tax=Aromatoleum petrolei TaxID=76116 RepID=A0ABX1MHQ8_9RHOO|nr:GlxA family transcriptional regulator [Aromatoleum petrolei]NMF87318.1 helix-turn-helix domain-containing protein [Aromatoleum petrolei]QTQ38565.1 Transcriptional regulator, AraC family [Aromatoleum petrolei]
MDGVIHQSQRCFESRLRHGNLAYVGRRTPGLDSTPITRRVVFVLLERFSVMAFTSAVDAIVTANLVAREPLYRFETCSLEESTVHSDLGIGISVDGRLSALNAKGIDLLVVCGGYRAALEPRRDVVDKLREVATNRAALGSLWNGSYLLAHAGLLDGYACTVHPDSRAGLEESYPRVRLQPHPFVIDRDRISSAGANSALSMMLAVLRQHHGDEVVRGVEDILACDRPVEDAADCRMRGVGEDPTLPEALRTVLQLMQNNVEEPLEIDDLAQHASISRRQMDRLFKRHMNATPSRYYLETRLTRARRLLQQTSESITSIAIACGFSNASHFSRCYREFFSVPPSRMGGSRRS